MIKLLDTNQWLPLGRDVARILLDSGLKSFVVLAVAGLAVAWMRRRSAAARHLVCFLAVASLLVLPILSWTLPGWRVLPRWMDIREENRLVVEHQEQRFSPVEPSAEIPPVRRQIIAAVSVPPEMPPSTRVSSPAVQIVAVPKPGPERARMDGWRAGLLAWLAGAVLATAPVVLGVISLCFLERASRRETGVAWLDLLGRLLTRLGFRRRVVLLKAVQRRMPMTWGVLCPKVLLPEESQEWPSERRRVVLLHELAHAQRFDYLTHLVTRLVCALYWFNPMVWLAARRMITEREHACDDIVLRHGAEPADYAEQVLEISAGLSTGWLAGLGGIAMARPSNLEGRLRAILDSSRNRAVLTRAVMFSTLLFLTAILVPVAMMKAATGPSSAKPSQSESLATSVETNTPPLERSVSFSAQQMPLKDVFTEVCRQAKVELDFDTEGVDLAERISDLPITVKFQDETLDSAFGLIYRAFTRQHGVHDFYREMRGAKVVVTSQRAEQARTLRGLPDWLKPMNNHGIVVKLDDEGNVFSIYADPQADDAFLAKLVTLPKLRELNLATAKKITPAGLLSVGELPALQKLYLQGVNREGGGLGNETLRALARVKTLRSLGIGECQVTDDGVRVLAGMTQLAELSLWGDQITDAGIEWLAGMTNLQSLMVDSRGLITEAGVNQLSKLAGLRDLSINSRGVAVLGAGISMLHRQSLYLSGAEVTDASLDGVVQCRELRQLWLTATGVSDAGLEKLANLKELRELGLDSETITDTGIAFLKSLPKLEKLQLRGSRLTDAAFKSLSQCKRLTSLDLGGALAPFQNSGQSITIEGLQQLKNLPHLAELSLHNFDAPSGFMGLRELKGLSILSLSFCNMGDDQKELLEAAMPDTSIEVMSGGMILREPVARAPLPNASVFLSGRAVDDATGQPVADCRLEFGSADPTKPDEVLWGQPTNGLRVEVLGTNPQDATQFWGETFRTGKVWVRVLASGYQPFPLVLKPDPAPLLASQRFTNFVARLQHGGNLQGVVADFSGRPVSGLHVFLADDPYFSLHNGVPGGMFKGSTATTDDTGRFALRGGNGTAQRVAIASADGHMVQVALKVDPEHEARVSLPQPATLIVRYDIPGDAVVAELFLNLESYKIDPVVWTNLNVGVAPKVTNQTEMVLTNLTPGNYRLGRRKSLSFGGSARAGSRFVFLDQQTFVLEPGRTQRVELVRPTGYTVRGEVAGISERGAMGAYIYAYPGNTNIPDDMLGWGRPFDALTCGTNGLFQTARLEPGVYTIVAMAYKEPDVYSHSLKPDFVGFAKVTVTTNAAPEPVKIELMPREGQTDRPAARPGQIQIGQPPNTSGTSESRSADLSQSRVTSVPTNWGEAIEGVSVQLQANRRFFELPEIPRFKALVRNDGTNNLTVAQTQQPDELEVDGVWFTWADRYQVIDKPLAAGTELGDILVSANPQWHQGSMPLLVGPGKHTFRFAVVAKRTGSQSGKDIRAVSNPVEVELQWPTNAIGDIVLQWKVAPNAIVRGNVVDADTRQPIKNFTVTPGYAGVAEPDLLLWVKAQTTQGRDGQYRVELGSDGSSALILVEAKGYAPEMLWVGWPSSTPPANVPITGTKQISEQTTLGTNTVHDFALRKSNGYKGKVVGANGQPVAAAAIAFHLEYGRLTFGVGNNLMQMGHAPDTYPQRSPITYTDSEGNFSLPATAGAASFVAISQEHGFAEAPVLETATTTVRLQSWARIKGVLRRNGKPLTNETVGIMVKNPVERGFVLDEIHHQTTTDEEGRFIFEQVPPGDYNVFRQLGGRYRANGFRNGVPMSWNFITNGEPIRKALFSTSAIKAEAGKTTVVELDAAMQEPNASDTNSSSAAAHKSGTQEAASTGRIPNTPETILAELRNIVPEDWTCQLDLKPGAVEGAYGQVKEPLFRLNFTNLSINLAQGFYWGPPVTFPPHPYLRLYFLPTTEKTSLQRRTNEIWNLIQFADTPDYLVVTSRSEVNSGLVGADMERPIAPLGHALEEYFGEFADKNTKEVMGMEADGSEGLHSNIGVTGQVVDDQTGKPIKQFELEWRAGNPIESGGNLVIQSNATQIYFGGRFEAKFRQSDTGWNMFWQSGKSSSDFQTGWVAGQKVWPRIQADGYLPAPLTPEPVAWPIKLTNLLIRLKRAEAPAQPASPPSGSGHQTQSATTNGIQYAAGFTPEKTEFTLGESNYLAFNLTNTGSRTILMSVDRRPRSMYTFDAFDAHGGSLSYPSSPFEDVGVIVEEEIEPGGVYTDRLCLTKFLPFEKPGEYTITASRGICIYEGDFPPMHKSGMPILVVEGTNSKPAGISDNVIVLRGNQFSSTSITNQFKLTVHAPPHAGASPQHAATDPKPAPPNPQSAPIHRDNPQSAWGEPLNGVSVRLTAAGPVWDFRQRGFFKFSVRNQGPAAAAVWRSQAEGELEMDGIWYRWSQSVDAKTSVLLPGGQFDDLPLTIGGGEWRKDANFPSTGPGKHTLRFAVPAKLDNGGASIRVVSNPLDVEFRWPASATNLPDTFIPGNVPVMARIEGRVVDDETGAAVTNFTPQLGVANPANPDEITWSLNLSGRMGGGEGRFMLQGQKAGQVWRILADGYLPQMVLEHPLAGTIQTSSLVVRLKRGGELRGVVVNNTGQPVPGAKVVIHRAEGSSVYNVFPDMRGVGDSSASTDAAGRFTLRGVDNTALQQVVVTSADGQQVVTALQAAPGQELNITLPRPATLIVRYDIPGDRDEAKLNLSRGEEASLSPVVTNRGQIALTNLTPGTYEFRRDRTLKAGVWQEWPCDRRTVVLEAGETQRVDLVRTNGQRLRGEVTGIKNTKATSGTLFVRLENDPGIPMSWSLPCFDAFTFDKDGHFQTALLEPGTYNVVANVYEPEVNTGIISTGIREPDYVGAAKVTITAASEPEPVKIELHPRNTSAKALAPTFVPVPAPTPAPAGSRGPAPRSGSSARSASPVGIPTASATSEPSILAGLVGQVVDDETGNVIGDYGVQAGVTNARGGDELQWGPVTSGPDGKPGSFGPGGWKPAQAWRILAADYLSQTVPAQLASGHGQTNNLTVRLKRGAELHGVVLDDAGRAVAGSRVYLVSDQMVSLTDGQPYRGFQGSTATTDVSGHFTLHGASTTAQTVTVASTDGQMVWPAHQIEPGQELTITLPKPAMVTLRYNIPGDEAAAQVEFRRHPVRDDLLFWKGVVFGFSPEVPNSGKLVLTNLAPGTYDFTRRRSFRADDGTHNAMLERRTITLEAGQAQEVAMIRASGQRLGGEVTGIPENVFDGCLYVRGESATGDPSNVRESIAPCFDALKFGKDGHFQTVQLEPGAYTFVACAYAPQLLGSVNPKNPNHLPDWVGLTKVTVTTNAAPAVKVELHPRVEPAKVPR